MRCSRSPSSSSALIVIAPSPRRLEFARGVGLQAREHCTFSSLGGPLTTTSPSIQSMRIAQCRVVDTYCFAPSTQQTLQAKPPSGNTHTTQTPCVSRACCPVLLYSRSSPSLPSYLPLIRNTRHLRHVRGRRAGGSCLIESLAPCGDYTQQKHHLAYNLRPPKATKRPHTPLHAMVETSC